MKAAPSSSIVSIPANPWPHSLPARRPCFTERSEAQAMADFLFGAAGVVLSMVALGLFRILQGPSDADRMIAAQLVGSGGVAILLLLATAVATPPLVDVALMLALLAAFASVAFVGGMSRSQGEASQEANGE
jgi:multicomponent Na+:H+ antiporter subunit F